MAQTYCMGETPLVMTNGRAAVLLRAERRVRCVATGVVGGIGAALRSTRASSSHGPPTAGWKTPSLMPSLRRTRSVFSHRCTAMSWRPSRLPTLVATGPSPHTPHCSSSAPEVNPQNPGLRPSRSRVLVRGFLSFILGTFVSSRTLRTSRMAIEDEAEHAAGRTKAEMAGAEGRRYS